MHPNVHSSIMIIIVAKTGEQLKSSSTEEWIKMWYILYIQWDTKEHNFAICSNMNEPGGASL